MDKTLMSYHLDLGNRPEIDIPIYSVEVRNDSYGNISLSFPVFENTSNPHSNKDLKNITTTIQKVPEEMLTESSPNETLPLQDHLNGTKNTERKDPLTDETTTQKIYLVELFDKKVTTESYFTSTKSTNQELLSTTKASNFEVETTKENSREEEVTSIPLLISTNLKIISTTETSTLNTETSTLKTEISTLRAETLDTKAPILNIKTSTSKKKNLTLSTKAPILTTKAPTLNVETSTLRMTTSTPMKETSTLGTKISTLREKTLSTKAPILNIKTSTSNTQNPTSSKEISTLSTKTFTLSTKSISSTPTTNVNVSPESEKLKTPAPYFEFQDVNPTKKPPIDDCEEPQKQKNENLQINEVMNLNIIIED